MAYTLTVLFRGLCVWVPGTDTKLIQEWCGAFLVNADAQKLNDLDDPRLNQHFPLVRFDLKDLKNSPSEINGKGLWTLDHEDVVIRPTKSVGPPLYIDHRGKQDFDQVPKLSELLGSGELLDDCLEASPSGGHVIARIHLMEGSLYADKLSSMNGNPVTIKFFPRVLTGVKVEKVIATGVALEMDNLQGDLTLRARKFGKEDRRDLVFADPGDNKSITIEILNLCAEELMGPPPRLPGTDEDFKLNYLPSKLGHDRVLNHLPLSIPVATHFDPGDAGGGEFARCTSPQASPLTDAQRAILINVAKSV